MKRNIILIGLVILLVAWFFTAWRNRVISNRLQERKDLLAAKQAMEDRYAVERAIGQANPAPSDPNAPYPIVEEQPFPTGIFDECDTTNIIREADITNCWQGVVNKNKTTVYVGVEAHHNPDIPDKTDPQQGVVFIWTIANYPEETGLQKILTPVRVGAVHITAEQNGVLTLVSTDNSHAFIFDVNTKKFTSVVKK